MSCLGVLFAIDSATSKRLRTASADEVMEIVGEVEEEWAEDFVMETDKAWDAIHRALSDGTLDPDGGEYPCWGPPVPLAASQRASPGRIIVALVSQDDVTGRRARRSRGSTRRLPATL